MPARIFSRGRHLLATALSVWLLAGSISCTPNPSDPPPRLIVKPLDPNTIELVTPDPLPLPRAQILQWSQRAGLAVATFYGHYPVHHVTLTVVPASRGNIKDGKEEDGQRITIHLGPDTQFTDLLQDWMLTHEMFHLSQPDLDEKYSWMSEGMADYLEPVARVRVAQITPEKFWQDLVEGLPQALQGPTGRGLDQTHSWETTYWGGCLYWFLADVKVREQTHNQKSVCDAAKAVLEAGGDGSQYWELDRLLDKYDRGSGTTVFRDLHNEMGTHPLNTDLAALWKSLGVIYQNGEVNFDDTAPLAAIRKAITSPY